MLRPRAIALASLLLATPGFAQGSDWTSTVTVYGWLPGLSTNLDTPFGLIDDDEGVSIFESLDMAFFGKVSFSNGTWGAFGDLAYADLEFSPSVGNGFLFSGAGVGTQLLMSSIYGTYRFVDTATVAIDAAAGLRSYDLDLSLDLDGATIVPDVSREVGAFWTDLVIGGRATVRFSDRWSARILGDVGGFGIGRSSDFSWQVIGVINYVFSDTWSMQAGYRYLSLERQIKDIDAELGLPGPMIGISASF